MRIFAGLIGLESLLESPGDRRSLRLASLGCPAFPTCASPFDRCSDHQRHLSSRFIINIPEEELKSVERICFQIEQAHWFYEDFVREENPKLPSYSLKNFSSRFFQYCPLLHEWAHDHETAFANFIEYKVRVPVCGAIILNTKMDKVLLVKGWKAGSGWGFPKGKINKDEPLTSCAVREVMEETGFDISAFLKESDYVERTMKEQRIRLYIITGIPENTVFETQTRKEIGDIKWHPLNSLSGWSKDPEGFQSDAIGSISKHKFYMVTAFVG
ncbi:Dcp2, box A domain-containing protein, partial [Polychytrium aggregatum]|uniref:Dcp2, box A domain-containing protein n=1 Tax=Polychytrium aggregatum TaxID=110093 RepID=UPI0022FE5958